MSPLRLLLVAGSPFAVASLGAGGPWDRIGPWNIFDDKDIKGEAGTLACAASPAQHPNLIYAGGQNNGVSSGIIKSVDAGKHWTRNSKGLWDTRILGVWLHPNHTEGNYVFAGTHTGIYESTDAAGSWTLCKETASWGNVMSFRQGMIQGKPYIMANSDNGILNRPMGGNCGWQKIAAPGGMPTNQHLSVNIHDGTTEVLTCIGGWGGGDMYYATINTPTNATWTGPIVNSTGTKINCANAAIDPKDRNHFMWSKGGEYHGYESKDGGKTTRKISDQGTFFVMIDTYGWLYTATQAGAFVSKDDGVTWIPYHVVMTSRSGKVIDRVPHDYQRIVPDFRGDGIAFPSDQGLHIVDRASFNLTSAVGDMRNTMSLSAIISPSMSNPGSRNLVVNIWDWDVAASWDDGATWAGWAANESSPSWCGEGGGGTGMGASGKVVIFHRNHWASSLDGGHNWIRGDTPGGPGGAFVYVRQPGSRSEPAGTCFNIMSASSSTVAIPARRDHDDPEDGHNWKPYIDEGDDIDAGHDDDDDNFPPYAPGIPAAAPTEGNVQYLMTSEDFGQNYTWKPLPATLQFGGLAVDPTTPNSLFGITANCLSRSTDKGLNWTPCSTATGLAGSFSQLIVKDSKVMFMLRGGAVPLRSKDGGSSWQELNSSAPLFKYGATMDGSLSWSGNTLVLHGVDLSAVGRGEYGTSVWKSTNDGDTWTDETGDLVTISPGPGVWYEKDFYLVTRGEGVTVKRNFEAEERFEYVV